MTVTRSHTIQMTGGTSFTVAELRDFMEELADALPTVTVTVTQSGGYNQMDPAQTTLSANLLAGRRPGGGN